MGDAMSKPEIRIGQIWRENDPRMERYVAVTFVRPDSITIIRVNADGSPYRGARHGCANPARFNGNRGGYSLHSNGVSP
jgi:hypothetical protein